MQKFKPQYRRLLFIERKIKESAYPNCVILAREWEVSAKTIQRDIDYLRDELGAPIAYDSLKHGYYYTEKNFSLPALTISESDLFAVCVAQTVLGQYRSTPLFKKLSTVFQKIRDSLPDKTTINPAWMDERILVFPEPATTVKSKIWDILACGIRDNRSLALCHLPPSPKSDERMSERIVSPYYLVSYKGEWYLSAYCHYRESIRTFAVSRITKARVLDETFTMPKGMTPNRMFGDRFGIIWKDKFYNVRIRFSAEVAPYIRERQWHPQQMIKDFKDGSLVLEFTTNHINEVKDWVLSWGGGATVLSPSILVEKTKLSLKQATANYR